MAKKEETQDSLPVNVADDLPLLHPRSEKYPTLPAPGRSRTKNGNLREDR